MNDCINSSSQSAFYIVSLSMSSVGQLHFFVLGLLVIYLMAVFGNLIIIILVGLVPKLQTPMYFFLCNLAIVDITSTSTCIPKLLTMTLTQDHKISFHCCMTQMFFFLFSANGEIYTLTSMAYDRYVAICKPLQYYIIMRKSMCIVLVTSIWIVGFINSLLHTILTSILQFCYSHDINHFICDLNSIIALSSTDITSRKIFIFFETVLVSLLLFIPTIISYIFIFSTILKIRFSAGRMKAFSSCTSHLITVILFYGPLMFLYMKPESEESKEQDLLLSLLYLVLVPMLNPMVYSLRNKEVCGAVVTLFNPLRTPHSRFIAVTKEP